LIDGPGHVAVACGLVALDAFEFGAFGNAQPLPRDLKIGSFLSTELSLAVIQILEHRLQVLARSCLLVSFVLVRRWRRLAVTIEILLVLVRYFSEKSNSEHRGRIARHL